MPRIVYDVTITGAYSMHLIVAGMCMQADTMHPFFAITKEISV
uniref:Uncharacterized protein MLCB2548.12 n=1 Tax=Mycobacterium leprae TaxID=1769 RepID=O69533_MYCLR|nr:hypothetical protein MLCB2548.12 [Mycobacterium leprae]